MSTKPKTTCLCGVHVHKCTEFSASFLIAFAVIGALRYSTEGIILLGIVISITGLMLYGMSRKCPYYYFPYLILMTIGIFMQCVTFPTRLIYAAQNTNGVEENAVFIALIAFVVLIIPYIYFFLVVPFHSYKLVAHENFIIKQSKLNPPPPTAPFNVEYP